MSPAPTPPGREPDPRYDPWGAPRAGGPPQPGHGTPSWPADRWSEPRPPQGQGPGGPRPAHGVHHGPGAGSGHHPSPGPGSWAGPPSAAAFPPWETAAHRAPFPSPLEQLQEDPALVRLRAARVRPAFKVTGSIVALCMLNVLLAGEARGFMSVRLAGPLNVGLMLSVLLCGATGWAVWWYGRHARTFLDPDSARVRGRLEELQERGTGR